MAVCRYIEQVAEVYWSSGKDTLIGGAPSLQTTTESGQLPQLVSQDFPCITRLPVAQDSGYNCIGEK